MSSLKGSFEYSIDNKGRVNIPAKLKKYVSPDANDTFVVTRGFEKCVYVYPHDEWLKFEQKLQALSPTEERDRRFLRLLLGPVGESQLDAQSRISISKELLKHAEIEDAVLIIGVLNHMELWNPAVYAQYLAEHDESYEDAARAFLSKV